MLQAERGASKNTLAAYGGDMRHVMGFLRGAGRAR